MTAEDRGRIRVELRGVWKRFGNLEANRGADLVVHAGEIHGVLGENGAGKSTLMRVLCGLTRPDAGEVRIDGTPVRLRSARDALDLGIAMMHQLDPLVPGLSVLENFLLVGGGRGPRLDPLTVRKRIRELGRAYGLTIDPDLDVADLTVGQRQWVSLLRLLSERIRVLVLDEPTATLTPAERDRLFELARRLRDNGCAIIVITHKLDEVMTLTDRVTVMRLGRTVATLDTALTSPGELALLMVGQELPPPRPRLERDPGDQLLQVEDLTTEGTRPALQRVTLDVRAGEVVGVAGVDGNGQHVLFACLSGQLPPRAWSGRIRLLGREGPVVDLHRVARIPEDRRRYGLAPGLQVWENLHLGRLRSRGLTRRGIVDVRQARRRGAELIDRYSIRTPGLEAAAGVLSGGNQQRLVLARELGDGPRLVLAMNPTAGLDVGATRFVLDTLFALRDGGAGVLLISYDLDELLSTCDRIVVMVAGTVVAETVPGALDPTQLGLLLGGATSTEAA